MKIKLIQPDNAPNFCFVVLKQVTIGKKGNLLKKPFFPDYNHSEYEEHSTFIQSDWEYPGTASKFGWVGEDSDLSGAYQFLCDNVGKIVEE